MKTIKMYLMSFMLMVFASISMAAETTTIEKGQTLAGIKTELIENLKNDGLITDANAVIAMQKYVSDPNESKDVLVKDDTGWRSHVTLANGMKLVGVLLLVFAFSGMIGKIIRACWIVIAAIPIIVYHPHERLTGNYQAATEHLAYLTIFLRPSVLHALGQILDL